MERVLSAMERRTTGLMFLACGSCPSFISYCFPHYIDVMHNKNNVAKTIFSTIFDIPEKTGQCKGTS
jgi:hypothetical protein